MVSDMCSEAGVNGKKTNHSLRVAGTTSLYEGGVPEKVIQQRTGHRCLESLRTYERVSSDQEMAVSRILAGEEKSYRESLENVLTTSVTKQSTVDAYKPSTPGVNCSNCTVNFYSGPSVPLPTHPFYQFNPLCYVCEWQSTILIQQVSTCLLCHRLIKRTCHFLIIMMSKTDNFSFFFFG